MKKYLILLLAVIFTASMLFVGIGCKEEAMEEEVMEEEAMEEEVAEEEVDETTSVVAEEKLLIYAQMGGSQGVPDSDARVTGALAAGEKWGAEVILQFAKWQSDVMINQFKEAIAGNPDGIVIMGHPGEDAMEPFVDEAIGMGIVVTANNVPLPRMQEKYQGQGFGYVGLHLYDAGYRMVTEAIKNGGLKSGDRVLTKDWRGYPSQAPVSQGISAACEEFGLIEDQMLITDELMLDPSLEIPIFSGYFGENPDCKAVIAFAGSTTQIAKELLTAAGLGPDDVYWLGADIGPKTIDAMKEGWVDQVLDQLLYLQGYLPVEQCILSKLYGFPGLDIDTGGGFVFAEDAARIAPLIDVKIR